MNFIDLTHFVKQSLLGNNIGESFLKDVQFQVFKCFRVSDGLILFFDFYPGFRFVIAKEGFSRVDRAPSEKAIELPLRLYLKSHFINKRLTDIKLVSASEAMFLFKGEALEILMRKENEFLELKMRLPQKKDYLQKIKLGTALLLKNFSTPSDSDSVALEGQEPIKVAEAPAEKHITHVERKELKLLENIKSDLKESLDWLQKWDANFKLLLENPEWGDREIIEKFSKELSSEIKSLQTKNIRDLLFKKKKKLEKKLIGTKKRLAEVEKKLSRGERVLRPTQTSTPERDSEDLTPAKPQKKPGIWVEMGEGLWARIGKSATENSELFRQAKDRDLWFHVRGQKGAHIWIPRGQKGFGAKDEAPDWLIQKGCELAALNSKIKGSGAADCDFTERRYLRSIKGAGPGQLEILRSKTRFVRIKN